MDGEWSRHFWATREKNNPAFVQGYWDAAQRPLHRKIASTIAALPVETVIEPGAHCGTNLRALDRERRFTWLVGTDLSEHVVAAGQRLLGRELRSPHALHVGSADDICYPDGAFDLCLASGLLVCVGPERIEQTLREMLRVTRRYIVLCEPFDDTDSAATLDGRPDPYPNTMYWIRNYPALLARTSNIQVISCERLPEQERSAISTPSS